MGNPVSRTAYYTPSLRAWDASRPQPLCGDFLAASLMDDEAQRVWDLFKDMRLPNVGNAARHAIIDEHLREAFAAQPDARVVVVGAGFDTRAFPKAAASAFRRSWSATCCAPCATAIASGSSV